MMVCIITSIGATKVYRNYDWFIRTLRGFIVSLLRQTNPHWRLFVGCHDIPPGIPSDPRISWVSLRCDRGCDSTLELASLPQSPSDPIVYERKPYNHRLVDMGRKHHAATIAAGQLAAMEGWETFWLLRVDADDLMADDLVEQIENADGDAVYSFKCYIYDPINKELGFYDYRYPITCIGAKLRFDNGVLPHWFALCRDHTTFLRYSPDWRYVELDRPICIICNTGNHISGRGRILENREARVTPIPLTAELKERYGIIAG